MKYVLKREIKYIIMTQKLEMDPINHSLLNIPNSAEFPTAQLLPVLMISSDHSSLLITKGDVFRLSNTNLSDSSPAPKTKPGLLGLAS